ncbi:MAG: response regulator [Phycisphaeraceae bacterium]|nr:response regulator [Phycisphaeraceae bacterium]
MTTSARNNGSQGGNGGHASDEDLRGKQVFTTGEAARVCNVSQQTIIRCFDSGRLTGFRVPGSKFRRIPRAELIRFMKENDIPLDRLGGERRRVLIVDDDPQILELLAETLSRDARFEVRTASTGYDAGMLTEAFRPDLVILDFMLPDINGDIVCRRIREHDALNSTRIICISGVVNRDEVDKLLDAGADEFIKKPFNIQQFVNRVNGLLKL